MADEIKQCSKCKQHKPLSEYGTRNRNHDGLTVRCKQCIAEWRADNKGKLQEIEKKSKAKYKERNKETTNKWRASNLERFKAKQKEWRESNPEKWRGYKRNEAAKRKASPIKRLNLKLATKIGLSLHGFKGGRRWESLVGYDVYKLKKHLEKQFKNGMTWENYGPYWHIDHKIPIAVFNFQTPEDIDFKRCWDLKNLQPLEAKKNLMKHTKIDKPFQPALQLNA